jgi:hypothetical protein
MAMQNMLLFPPYLLYSFSIHASFDNYVNISWNEDGRSIRQRYYLPFVESEVSLPCSQQTTYGHYKKPKESSPHSQSTLLVYININIILPSKLQGFHSNHFFSAFTLPIYTARFS